MTIVEFKNLELCLGDNIWIMDEEGRGFSGTYGNGLNNKKKQFMFNNFSNGQSEIIEIEKIQRIEILK